MPGASFESETIAASRERLTSRFLLTPQNAKSEDLTPPPPYDEFQAPISDGRVGAAKAIGDSLSCRRRWE
jgi:hypothetical protein